MNTRERFLAVMDLQRVAPPKWEFGYWGATLRRWYEEGLARQKGIPDDLADGGYLDGGAGGSSPTRLADSDVNYALGMDPGMLRLAMNNYLCPAFTPEVLEVHEGWVLARDEKGMIVKRRPGQDSLPHFIRGPVETCEDWERLKAERLQPSLQGRLNRQWPGLLASYKTRTVPLALGGGQGFFGTPRYLFGEVQVLTAYYDYPDLMHTIVNDLADFWVALYDQILDLVDVDLALIWEDMAFKTGPLVSPAIFRRFILPGYKKLTAFLRDRGIRVILVDCDGNVWKLIPLFIEGGVTGVYPFEVMAGMNVAEVRHAFPRLQILGGLDKTSIAKGTATTDVVLHQVPEMLNQGGYIPYVDHFVPPDVSWHDFSYYRQELNRMIDDVGIPSD